MRADYQLLHSDMIRDINRCWQLELSENDRVEQCFWIGHSYWDQLKERTKEKPFKDDIEEIEFFRNVKPAFTRHIEFYVMLSGSLPFIPLERDEAITFWEEEMKRFPRYCAKNELFVAYYESGQRYQDSLYFLRRHWDQRIGPMAAMYDIDTELLTSYDPLVRSYEAHKMYYEFARERKELLDRNKVHP